MIAVLKQEGLTLSNFRGSVILGFLFGSFHEIAIVTPVRVRTSDLHECPRSISNSSGIAGHGREEPGRSEQINCDWVLTKA